MWNANTVYSERGLLRTQKELLSIKISQIFASIKIENVLHNIIKIPLTRKIKFQKIQEIHSYSNLSLFVDVLYFLNHCIFYNLTVRQKFYYKNTHENLCTYFEFKAMEKLKIFKYFFFF